MREIVLDTETTGFEPETGDRDRRDRRGRAPQPPADRPALPRLHQPRAGDARGGLRGARARRRLPARQAASSRRWRADFLDFIGDARLVIHNAAFDMKFLNHELGGSAIPPMPMDRAIDTVAMARRKFPGAPASLDALCRRFGIDNSARTLHGALLDSELLAEVYLELIGGRQPGLTLAGRRGAAPRRSDAAPRRAPGGPARAPCPLPPGSPRPRRAAHAAFVAAMGDGRALAPLSAASGVERAARPFGRPRAAGLPALGAPGDLAAVERHEVDHLEVQGREAAVARHVRDDPAQEREGQARAFDQQVGVHLLLGQRPRSGTRPAYSISSAKSTSPVPLFLRGDLQLGHHLVLVVAAALLAVEADLDGDLGGDVARHALAGQHVLERQVADVLGEDALVVTRGGGGAARRRGRRAAVGGRGAARARRAGRSWRWPPRAGSGRDRPGSLASRALAASMAARRRRQLRAGSSREGGRCGPRRARRRGGSSSSHSASITSRGGRRIGSARGPGRRGAWTAPLGAAPGRWPARPRRPGARRPQPRAARGPPRPAAAPAAAAAGAPRGRPSSPGRISSSAATSRKPSRISSASGIAPAPHAAARAPASVARPCARSRSPPREPVASTSAERAEHARATRPASAKAAISRRIHSEEGEADHGASQGLGRVGCGLGRPGRDRAGPGRPDASAGALRWTWAGAALT